MNPKISKSIKFILPLAIGFGLVYYSLSKLSQQDIIDIKNAFKNANYWWVGLALVFGVLSHLSRAYRWKFMLEPLGYKPKFWNSAMAVLVAYLVNLGIPRAGEVSRATVISEYEDIPFDKAFGTIVTERIVDLLVMLMIIALTLVVQFDTLWTILSEKFNPISIAISLIGLTLLVALIVLFIKKSTTKFAFKIKSFITGIAEGMKSVFKMKNKGAFIFHSLFIWVMYILMFYVTSLSLKEMELMSLGATLTGFIAGGFSIATTNGGLGAYPIAVAGVLQAYGYTKGIATAFGWIMWTSQTLMIVFFGGLAFLFLPIFNKNK